MYGAYISNVMDVSASASDLDVRLGGLPISMPVHGLGRLWVSPRVNRDVAVRPKDGTRRLYEYWNPNPRSLSLVIPAYNEEDRLGKALTAYLPALERLHVPFEVLVICDGRDRTPAVARSFANRGVVCFEYPNKLGRGGAILEGFRKCQGDLIAFADADASVPAADLEQMVALALAGPPAVIASRRLRPEVVPVPEPAFRRSIGFVWHLLVKFLLDLQLEDAQCGLKIFSKRVVRDVILKQLTVTNRTFEVGMLFHVARSGIPIVEIPVKYVHDFDTRMPIGRAWPVMLLTLVGILFSNRLAANGHQAPAFVVELNRKFASV